MSETETSKEESSETAASGTEKPLPGFLDLEAYLTEEAWIYWRRPSEQDPEQATEQKQEPEPEQRQEDSGLSDLSAADWKKYEKDTLLTPADLVSVYLPYSIPAGTLDETIRIAYYRLPEQLVLSDDRLREFNETENAVSSSLGKDDPSREACLGAEAIEGTRKPDEARKGREAVSATVKVQNVRKDPNLPEGQYIVFTFTSDTVRKNRRVLDDAGNLLAEGGEVRGFFTVDYRMDEIAFSGSECAESEGCIEASILLAAKDPASGRKEIRAGLRLAEDPDPSAERTFITEEDEDPSEERNITEEEDEGSSGEHRFITEEDEDPSEERNITEEEDEGSSGERRFITEEDSAEEEPAAAAVQGRKASSNNRDTGTRVETTDLSEVTHIITIRKGEYVVDFENGGDLLFHDGDEFEINLYFEEKPLVQFQHDSTPMYFNLPDGFNLRESFSFEKDITISDGGETYTVSGNMMVYEPAVTDGPEEEQHPARIRFTLNDQDPNFSHLANSEDVSVDVTINGTFSFTPGQTVTFGDKEITLVEPHDAGVSKTAAYDPSTKSVNYTVVVAADQAVSETVHVEDVVGGAALTITGGISVTAYAAAPGGGQPQAEGRTDITAAVNPDGKGFSSDIPGMTDGETVVYTYAAEIDYTKLSRGDGETVYDEAGNTVRISGMNPSVDYTYNNEDEQIPKIPFTDIKKDVEMDGQVTLDANGNVYKYIHWTIEVNAEALATLAGAPVYDHFNEYNSNLPMYYAGNGLTIERYERQYDDSGAPVVDGEGNPVLVSAGETESVSWKSLGIANPNSDSYRPRTTPWTWTVPEDDAPYKYVIRYDTRVDMRRLTGTYDVVNYAEVKGLGADAPIVVKPIGGGPDIDLEKELLSMSNDQLSWKITVHLRPEGYDAFTVNDLLPNVWINNEFYTDAVTKDNAHIEVLSGLVEGETLDWDNITITGKRGSYTTVAMPFLKQDEQGEWIPGLKGTGEERTLQIRITTENNRDWLQLMLGEHATWQEVHTNRAEVWADDMYDLGIATASPLPLKIDKKYSKPSDNNGVEYRQTTNVLGDGTPYADAPLYRFQTKVSGVLSDTLTVHDAYDKNLFSLYKANNVYVELAGSDNAWWHQTGEPKANITEIGTEQELALYKTGTGGDYGQSIRAKITGTEDGFDVTYDVPKRASDGGYFSYYYLIYYLVPKDLAAMEEILRQAGANPQEDTPYGLAVFENAAWIDGAEPKTAEFDYPYKASGKTANRNGNRISYELELNTAKAKLNGGHTIDVYDEHSTNLSVIYSTVQWTTEPAANHDLVTWDMSGSKATFRIPDETFVKITYDANVIVADGKTEDVWNRLDMLGCVQEVGEENIEHSGGGSGGVYSLRIYKYHDGDMTRPLSGAVFRLLDENKNPMHYPAGYPKKQVQQTDGSGNPVFDDSGNPVMEWVTDEEKEGGEITFGTQADGYVNVTLNVDRDGERILKNTPYYLEEIQAPEGYRPDFVLYSFLISDNPDYSAPGGIYVYSSGDIAKIRNREDDGGLYLAKRINGNVELTDDQLAGLQFLLEKEDSSAPGGWTTVKTIPYSELTNGSIHITKEELADYGAGIFRVREEGQEIGYNLITIYNVDGSDRESQEDAAFLVADGSTASHSVVITNTYFDHSYSFTKTDAATGAVLRGAEFEARRASDDVSVHTYTTAGVRGNFIVRPDDGGSIMGGGWLQPGVLYYMIETKAPEGYRTPTDPEKYYFYYTDETHPAPSIPSGITVVDLTDSYGAVTIGNESETKTSVVATKAWLDEVSGDASAPEGAEVVFELLKNGEATGQTVTLDGVRDPDPEEGAGGITSGETSAWRAEWTDLDAFTGSTVNAYTVREISMTGADGYAMSAEEAESGSAITNIRRSADLRFSKEWYGKKGLSGKKQAWPENTAAQFTLTRSLQADGQEEPIPDDTFRIVYTIDANRVTGIEKTPADANGTIARTTGEYSAIYDYHITGLDATGRIGETEGTWVYALAETGIQGEDGDLSGDYQCLEKPENSKLVFQNIPRAVTLDLTAFKTWKTDETHEVPEADRPAGVEFTLYHKVPYMTSTSITAGGEYYDLVRTDAAGETLANPILVTADSEWSAAFRGVSQYKENSPENGEEIYLVKETAVYFGGTGARNRTEAVSTYYTATGGTVFTENETTVNNVPAAASVTVAKQWDEAFASDTTKSASFTLYREGEEYLDADGRAVTVTLPTAGGGWTDTVTGLPRYDAEGNTIRWSLKETAATLGGAALDESGVERSFFVYKISGGERTDVSKAPAIVDFEEDAGSITLRNAPAQVELNVSKTWAEALAPTAEQAVFTVFQNGTEYLDADDRPVTVTLPDGGGNWTGSVVVPKYDDDGKEITWSFQETCARVGGQEYTDPASIREAFFVTARDGSGNDAAITESGAAVPVSSVSKSGTLDFCNDLYPTTGYTVSKEWYDPDGNRIEAPAGLAYEKQFQLYRTITRPNNADSEARYGRVYIAGNSQGEGVLSRDSLLTFAPGSSIAISAAGQPGTRYTIYKTTTTDTGWRSAYAGTLSDDGEDSTEIQTGNDWTQLIVYIPAYALQEGYAAPVFTIRTEGADGRLFGTFTESLNNSRLVNNGGAAYGDPFTLPREDGSFEISFDTLPKNDADGNEYAYFVKEIGAAADTSYVYAGRSVTVKNTEPDVLTINLTKEWDESLAGDTTLEAEFELIRKNNAGDETVVQTVTLPQVDPVTNERSWTASIDKLPRKDGSSKAYAYYLKEISATSGGVKLSGSQISSGYHVSAADGEGNALALDDFRAYAAAPAGEGHELAASVTFTNELLKNVEFTVRKEWYDANGNKIESPAEEAYNRYFTLYRLTGNPELSRDNNGRYVRFVKNSSSNNCVILSPDSIISTVSGDVLSVTMSHDPGDNATSFQLSNQQNISGWPTTQIISGENGRVPQGESSRTVDVTVLPDSVNMTYAQWNSQSSTPILLIQKKDGTSRLYGTFTATANAQLSGYETSEIVPGYSHVLLDVDEDLSKTFSLPERDENGNKYAYFVVEEGEDTANTSYKYEDGRITILNKISNKDKVDVRIYKEWYDNEQSNINETKDVIVDIYRTIDNISGTEYLGSESVEKTIKLNGNMISVTPEDVITVYKTDIVDFSFSSNNYPLNIAICSNWTTIKDNHGSSPLSVSNSSTNYPISAFITMDAYEYWNTFSAADPLRIANWKPSDPSQRHTSYSFVIKHASQLTRDGIIQYTNGLTPIASETLTALKSYSFSGQYPKYDPNGNEYHYFAVERIQNGYSDEYIINGNRTIIRNTQNGQQKEANISFSKEWYGSDTADARRVSWPAEIGALTVTLRRKAADGTVDSDFRRTYRIDAEGAVEGSPHTDISPAPSRGKNIYSYEIRGLEKGTDGNEWIYFIEESQAGGYDPPAYFTENGDAVAAGVEDRGTIRNIRSQIVETTDISVSKVWADGKADQVSFRLYRIGYYMDGSQAVPVSEGYYSDEIHTVTPPDPTVLTGLPEQEYVEIDGVVRLVSYQYRVMEEPVSGYHASYDHENHVITNTPASPAEHTTSLDVKKKWLDQAGEPSDGLHGGDSIAFKVIQYAVKAENVVPVTVHYTNRTGQNIREDLYVTKGTQLQFTFTKGTNLFASHTVQLRVENQTTGNISSTDYTLRAEETAVQPTVTINDPTVIEAHLTYYLLGADAWGDTAVTHPLNYIEWAHDRAAASGSLYESFNELCAALEGKEADPDEGTPYTMTKTSVSTEFGPDPYTAASDGDWGASFTRLPDFQKVGDDYYIYTYEIAEISVNGIGITHGQDGEWMGHTDEYLVKWEKDTETGVWVITNKERPAEFSFTKEWRGPDGGSLTPWPKDQEHADLPIDVTITGRKAGAGDLVLTKRLTSETPASDAGYTLTAADDRYTFTFTGLKSGYEYEVTEAAVNGYFTEYYLAGSTEKQLSGINWTKDKGTIRNLPVSYELPSTGGVGTGLLYKLALFLIVLAGTGSAFLRPKS